MQVKVICITNQKGGVGKTATTAILASALTKMGKRVLAIDMDPQGSLSNQAGMRSRNIGVHDVLSGKEDIHEAIQNTEHFDILPTNIRLAALEAELMSDMGKYFKLRDALEDVGIRDQYDYALIDTPPSLGTLSVNAIVAADYIIIPTDADIDSISGIIQLGDTIRNAHKYFGANPVILGILFTKIDVRQNNSKDMMALAMKVADTIGTKVFNTHIRETVTVRTAKSHGENLLKMAPKCTVSQDYEAFADELLKGGI